MPDDPHRAWVTFDAMVESLPWGRNVYTVIRLDPAVVEAARAFGTRRVEGTIEGAAVNVGVNRADVLPEAFVYAGGALQRRCGVTPGDVVRCRLRPADPDDVPLPRDVHDALEAAGRRAAFDRLAPPERRRRLAPVEDAVRPETRQRRIGALLRALAPD